MPAAGRPDAPRPEREVVMPGFDLVVRGGTVATAADVFRADIGVREGRIAALGEDLPAGREEIDASGRLVLPGGVDAHCHLDQPTGDGSVMADDFLSGTRSAACGGTTTVMPFAAQVKGQSLRAAVDDYHRRAEGKATVDYAFHLIVTDPTRAGAGPGAAGADPRRLHVVQGLHDLRRPEAERPPDPRRARARPGATARWSWSTPRTPTASAGSRDGSSSPAGPRRSTMPPPGRWWSSARRRTGRSRSPSWSTCRS